jgi:hypothetical protein
VASSLEQRMRVGLSSATSMAEVADAAGTTTEAPQPEERERAVLCNCNAPAIGGRDEVYFI